MEGFFNPWLWGGPALEDLALATRYISSSRRLDETHTDGLRPFTARTREQRAHGERARGGEGDVCT